MTDPHMKIRPGLDELSFQIAEQMDECELLRRVYHELSVGHLHLAGDGGEEFKAFYGEHLAPQIQAERDRLKALVVRRGERLAALGPPAPPAAPPDSSETP